MDVCYGPACWMRSFRDCQRLRACNRDGSIRHHRSARELLTLGLVVIASAVGAAIADRLTRRPIRAFLIIVGAALLLSYLPIALLSITGPSAGTLVFMHVVAAAIPVGLLTTLARKT